MRSLVGFVVCFLTCSVTLASKETYSAGIFDPSVVDGDLRKYVPLIQEAGKSNIDILVLPSPKFFSSLSSIDSYCGVDKYDEVVETLSESAKQAGVYVVAHLLEKTICQSKYELIRSNLVFGRDGNIVSVYRKPLKSEANCTTAPSEMVTFTTDFGIQFGLLMEEDLVLRKEGDLYGLKNFVVAGAWSSEIPFLSVSQFASSWAFTNKVNVVTSSGAFVGRRLAQSSLETGVTAVHLKNSAEDVTPDANTRLSVFPEEDLSQYIIRPLNVEASAKGYKETVCHDGHCCEFYVKTSFVGPKDNEVNYGLAAFNGIRKFGYHNIGAQTCAVFACAGLYKRSCTLGSSINSTNIIFEKISIQTISSGETSQYPIVMTAGSKLDTNQFHFDTKTLENQRMITLETSKAENVLSFGVFGRDFSKDSERSFTFEEELSFKDEMNELFDYLWIRIRILIFVVSIYFLEMM